MKSELEALSELSPIHGERGRELFAACNAEIFPCDALAYAVLERSLNLLKGFHLLMENGGYMPGVGLLRMQLDSILRFNGVVRSLAPHETASLIINGTSLRTLKDRSGIKMTDKHLVSLLLASNPWVEHVYSLASSYIHLSDQHFFHMLARSKGDGTGKRDICIGDDDEHIPVEQKEQLVNAFAVLTRGILNVISQWTKIRHEYGSNEHLNSLYDKAV